MTRYVQSMCKNAIIIGYATWLGLTEDGIVIYLTVLSITSIIMPTFTFSLERFTLWSPQPYNVHYPRVG